MTKQYLGDGVHQIWFDDGTELVMTDAQINEIENQDYITDMERINEDQAKEISVLSDQVVELKEDVIELTKQLIELDTE